MKRPETINLTTGDPPITNEVQAAAYILEMLGCFQPQGGVSGDDIERVAGVISDLTGPLKPANTLLRAYVEEEISIGRLRECIRLWGNKEAFQLPSATQAADAAYIAMFALDPEVAELRDNLRMTQKAHLMTCQELVNAENEAQIMEKFLTAQGYVRREDGTWKSMSAAELAALREKYKAITEDAVSGIETVQSVEHYYEEALDRRESELAALRPVVEAAVLWSDGQHPQDGHDWDEVVRRASVLRAAVRAWREQKR